MTSRLAYEEIVLEHGGNAVRLRPSLRAATALEQSHDGLANLFRRLTEFDTGTVREIITVAATDRQAAARFLDTMSNLPIRRFVEIAQASLMQLVAGFIPQPDPEAKPDPSARPIPWPRYYRDLFRSAAGVLHWSPDQVWQATPTEITEALAGHSAMNIAMLKAMNGVADEQKQDGPDFSPLDRVGLEKLRSKGGMR